MFSIIHHRDFHIFVRLIEAHAYNVRSVISVENVLPYTWLAISLNFHCECFVADGASVTEGIKEKRAAPLDNEIRCLTGQENILLG